MSQAKPYYAALSSLLHESGERPTSDIRALRPRNRLVELHSTGHPIAAAVVCLQAAWQVEAFGSALVCINDVDTGKVVVVYASGPDADGVVLQRDAGDAEPSYTASCVLKPFVHRYSESSPRALRHRFMPPLGEVLVAPVTSFGRCLATFEILGRGRADCRFGAALESALGEAAARYGEYLDALGVVLGFSIAEREGGYVLRQR